MGELSVIDVGSTRKSSRSLVGKSPQPSVPVVARLLATMQEGEYDKNWQKLQALAILMKCLMGQIMMGDMFRLAMYSAEDLLKQTVDQDVQDEMLEWFMKEVNDSHRRNPFTRGGFAG